MLRTLNWAHSDKLIPLKQSLAQLDVLKGKEQIVADEGTTPDKNPSMDLDIHQLKKSTQLGDDEGPHQISSHLETPRSRGKNIMVNDVQIRRHTFSPRQLEMLRAKGKKQFCKVCATMFEATLDDKMVCSSCKRVYHAKCVNLASYLAADRNLYSKVYKCPACIIRSNFEIDRPFAIDRGE